MPETAGTAHPEPKPAPELSPEDQKKLLATGMLFQTLAGEPKYRKRVLGLIKEASPDTPIPELDLEGAVTKELEERFKPKDEELKTMRERLESMEKEFARNKWQSKTGLSEEEAVEVEELAKKGQIGNSETAVDYWRAKQALGTPRGTRRAPAGATEYLEKLSKINPRSPNKLKEAALEEATRILNSGRRM